MTRGSDYSPDRRTALVLCGTGADGAYHAGVLKALQEAGVKIDVMAGHGVGAAAAALAAVDGAARLWSEKGIWRGGAARSLYQLKLSVRLAAWFAGLLTVAVLATLLLALGDGGPPRWLVFAALALAGAILVVLVGAAAGAPRAGAAIRRSQAVVARPGGSARRRARRRARLPAHCGSCCTAADPVARPTPASVGRRYAEVLAESVGQPGFRELMIVATDLDSRRDVVAALLREPFRREFVAPRAGEERQSEIIDLAGTGRDHAVDVIAAALTPPVACDPHLVTFGVDTYWRGETHRLCDRPGACTRLLDELADVQVTQAILVSAVAAPHVPHRLAAARLEPRHRLGEFLAAAESASLRDARLTASLRFDSVHVISPAHNAIGPFDLSGAYDEASDRWTDLSELMNRGYEDAYRQFIEPVVGASGEQMAHGPVEIDVRG